MKRALLAALWCSLAWAQDETSDKPAAEAPPAAERPAPKAEEAAPPSEPPAEAPKPRPRKPRSDAGLGAGATDLVPAVDRLDAAAKAFFSDLLTGDARSLVTADSALPFYVEDRRFTNADELTQEWLKNLRGKRTDLLTLYGVEILAPSEMEKRYGKPPARLAQFPWKQSGTYLAIANLSGRAAIALLQAKNGEWRVVGYTD